VFWTKALREKHLKEGIEGLVEDLPKSSKDQGTSQENLNIRRCDVSRCTRLV
jgi:hypothetical protein